MCFRVSRLAAVAELHHYSGGALSSSPSSICLVILAVTQRPPPQIPLAYLDVLYTPYDDFCNLLMTLPCRSSNKTFRERFFTIQSFSSFWAPAFMKFVGVARCKADRREHVACLRLGRKEKKQKKTSVNVTFLTGRLCSVCISSCASLQVWWRRMSRPLWSVVNWQRISRTSSPKLLESCEEDESRVSPAQVRL